MTGPANTTNNDVICVNNNLYDWGNVSTAFLLLTVGLSRLLKRVDFSVLRRAILRQRKTPGGVQFPDDLYQSIKTAQDFDTLLDLLADSQYWSWVDLRLLETLVEASGIREAKVLINKYKEMIFSQRLTDVLNNIPMPQQKQHKIAYISKAASMIAKEPDELTVGDLAHYRHIFEAVIMDINNGSCVLEHLEGHQNKSESGKAK